MLVKLTLHKEYCNPKDFEEEINAFNLANEGEIHASIQEVKEEFRGFIVEGRQFFWTKRQMVKELGCPPEDIEAIWESGYKEGDAFWCQKCGNASSFSALGHTLQSINDQIARNGEIDEYGDPEGDGIEYDAVVCDECDAEVEKKMPKKEADRIIRGAYEWLKEE